MNVRRLVNPLDRILPTFRHHTSHHHNGRADTISVFAIDAGDFNRDNLAQDATSVFQLLQQIFVRQTRSAIRETFPHWSDATIQQQTRGIFTITNLNDGQGAVAQATGRGDNQIIRIQDITPDMLQGLVGALQKSNTELFIEQVEFNYILDPRTFIAGSAQDVKPPTWVNKRYFLETWKPQQVNCAAFSLAYYLSTMAQRRNLEGIRRRAREMMTLLNWGDSVAFFELERFVEWQKDYKLFLVLPVTKHLDEYVFTGSRYRENGKEKIIYLVWDPQQVHYGLTQSAEQIYRAFHNSQELYFCDKCATCYGTTCRCENAQPVHDYKRQKTACKTCGLFGCAQTCPKLCTICMAIREKNHRCIVYDKPNDAPKGTQN